MMSKKEIRGHVESMLSAMLDGIEFDASVECEKQDMNEEECDVFDDILTEYDFVITKNNRIFKGE